MRTAEDETIAAARAGDPDAWRELYRAHAGRLVAWLGTRRAHDVAMTPEDIAAEAWLVAASKIAEFEGDSDRFAGWLFGIARHVESNTRRRSERRRTYPDAHVPEVAVGDATVAVDRHDWVRQVISSLPPRERDVVGLLDGLGFDTDMAATALGISQVAVRTARHRGLRRLRRTMDPAAAPATAAS